MEEDLVVGTVPLVPLEPFESSKLFEGLSILELVFLRRNSLNKGIVCFRCLVRYANRTYVYNCPQTAMAFMENGVEWNYQM